jgi:hypothetical protein
MITNAPSRAAARPSLTRTAFGVLAFAVAALVAIAVARAETLVVVNDDGVQPQVVTAWTADGREVELSVRGDADPAEVADAIESGIDRVKAKVRAGRVVVIGKSLEELLPLLAVIEVGGGESLAELDQLAAIDTELGSGSSLRAKLKAEREAAFADPETTLVAQVVDVDPAAYPRTRLKLRVLRSPRGKELKKAAPRGSTILVVPHIPSDDGRVSWDDPATRMNAGAYYLQPKDRVRVRISGGEDGVFVADAIARTPPR